MQFSRLIYMKVEVEAYVQSVHVCLFSFIVTCSRLAVPLFLCLDVMQQQSVEHLFVKPLLLVAPNTEL